MSQFIAKKNLPDDAKAAGAGLRQIREVQLQPGEILYRYSSTVTPWRPHSTMPTELYGSSPWWFRERYLTAILGSWTQFDEGFRARVNLAVQQGWKSRMDVRVKARVTSPLRAFEGLPRKQFPETPEEIAPNGMRWVMGGNVNVLQLYIPGINDRGGLTALGRSSLKVLEYHGVSSQQIWDPYPSS
ncbi:MAG: hypothetical protein AAF517_23600 [Planctomycetota bacterium]